MKKILLLSVLALLTIAMYAQDFRMQSTSSYLQQTTTATSSAYNAPLSAPGAVGPAAMYSTTYEPSSNSRGRRSIMDEEDEDPGMGTVGDFTPIGSPLIPLLLLAAAYVLVVLLTQVSLSKKEKGIE